MKTAVDPRHQKRREIVRLLFSYSFQAQKNQQLNPLISKLKRIDEQITRCAPEWPIGRINKVDLAVLRLAIYELTWQKKTPPKVVLDEAVELAKEFGSENSGRFINGVLANLVQTERKDAEN